MAGKRILYGDHGLHGDAIALNLLGLNPMKSLILSVIGHGLSPLPLLRLIMLMTNDRRTMGDRVNSRWRNILGWTTTVAIFLATAGLVATWVI